MTMLTAEKASMQRTPAATTPAAALVAAAVEDYRHLLPAVQRERLLAVCLEALDGHRAGDPDPGPEVERLAGDMLAALCPEAPSGVRAALAWICGDVAGR
ncbi:MAG: hypothetical protein ACTHNS_08935 [Marmoricola sp.]